MNSLLSRSSRSSAVSVKASGENPLNLPKFPLPPSFERRCKECAERRKVKEQSRALHVRRIQQELQRISQREIEFAQRLVADYTSVQVSLNESALEKLMEFLPFRIELKKEPEPAAAEQAVHSGQAGHSGQAVTAEELIVNESVGESPIA